MSHSYRVQALVAQNSEATVHRVVAKSGVEFVHTRLGLEPEVLAGLFGEGVFEKTLSRLKELECQDLRVVVDGGMDEEDGAPWVTSPWLEGKALSERKLTERDIRSLGEQCQRLRKALGKLANAVSFDSANILTVRTPDEQLHSLFTIDYARWFRDGAEGNPLGMGKSAAKEVRGLLKAVAIQQLKPAKKEREVTAIPFVEDRSPALTSYVPPQERWVLRVLTWAALVAALGVIIWLTWVGMNRGAENPRKEVPAWNAPSH